MFSKLSVVVGIAATLQSAVAQNAITGPLDNYPAKNIADLPGFEGTQDPRCTPSGPNVRWNETYFPCRYTRELDNKCAAVIPSGASDAVKLEKWEQQRKCLCVDNPDYFDAAGEGCVGCKKAYKLETDGNFDKYTGLFKELEGEGYCKSKAPLTGSYADYYAKLAPKYPADYSNMPAPLPPKSIAVEDYWTRRDQKKAAVEPVAPANTSVQGTADLPPVVAYNFGFVDMAPETNSSKFASKTKETAVGAVTIVNRRLTVNGNERTVEAQAQQPVLYTLSSSVDVSIKTTFTADILTDFSACTCAQAVVPKGNRPVVSQQGLELFYSFTAQVGYTVSKEQQSQQQHQCFDCSGPVQPAPVESKVSPAAVGKVESMVNKAVAGKVEAKVNNAVTGKVDVNVHAAATGEAQVC